MMTSKRVVGKLQLRHDCKALSTTYGHRYLLALCVSSHHCGGNAPQMVEIRVWSVRGALV